MKKLIILLCLLFPVLCRAQSVQTLKNQADTLRKHGKEKKAGKLYKKAIERVLTYQERISDYSWLSLSLAEHENELARTKKDNRYINFEYGNEGSVLKDKIKMLASKKAKCIFTYYEWLSMTSIIDMVRDSVSGKYIGFNYDNRRLLVWVDGNDVYFQEFSSSNIYKPLAIQNDTLRDILINHADEMIHQPLKKEYWKHSESPFFTFEFYIGQELWSKILYDPKYLRNPEANSKTWLAKLMPLIWQEFKLYRTKAIAGI